MTPTGREGCWQDANWWCQHILHYPPQQHVLSIMHCTLIHIIYRHIKDNLASTLANYKCIILENMGRNLMNCFSIHKCISWLITWVIVLCNVLPGPILVFASLRWKVVTSSNDVGCPFSQASSNGQLWCIPIVLSWIRDTKRWIKSKTDASFTYVQQK